MAIVWCLAELTEFEFYFGGNRGERCVRALSVAGLTDVNGKKMVIEINDGLLSHVTYATCGGFPDVCHATSAGCWRSARSLRIFGYFWNEK